MSTYIFVYGSLRKGLINHHFLGNSEYIGDYVSEEQFYMVTYKNSKFPYLLEDLEIDIPKTYITGEIYKVSDIVLNNLDNLESNSLVYQRKKYKFYNKDSIIEAYVYVLIKPLIIDYIKENLDKNYFLINSGDWCEFLYSGK